MSRVNKPNYRPEIYFCPNCGNALDNESFVVEYWHAEDNVYFCWCSDCSWQGEIKAVKQMVTTELSED